MYNRKFNIKNSNDFRKLVELEYDILPIVRKKDDEQKTIESYIMKTFKNQWKS